MSVSVGGLGGGVTIESAKPMSANGDLPSQFSTEQKISAPLVSAVQKSGEGSQYSGLETELVSGKLGFYYEVEFSMSINCQTNNVVANAPPSGNPIATDKTSVQIYVPDFVPNAPTTSK